MATEDEVRRIILEVLGVEKVSELQDYVDDLNESMGGGGGGGGGKGGKGRSGGGHNLQQNLTAASYALQDFTSASGDLGQKLNAISNNIPGILAGLGGLATAASALVTVGIAIYRNWDSIAGLFEKGFKLPETADAVENLTDKIKENKKEMEALEKQTHLTFEATEKYSELVTKTAAMEQELAFQRKSAASFEKFGVDKPEAAARGAAFVQGAQGYREEILQALVSSGMPLGVARATMARAAQGGQVSIDEIMGIIPGAKGIPRTLPSHIRAGMPEFKEQVQLADEETKRIREDEALAEKKLEHQQQEKEKADRARVEMNTAQMKAIEDARQVEEQAAKGKVNAQKKAAAVAEQNARRSEREGIEDVRLKVDQAVAGGAPAGMVAAQANAMLNRIAQTSGRTTNLAQAQGRLMLHLQQVAERQERQLESAERDLRRAWDTASRRGN